MLTLYRTEQRALVPATVLREGTWACLTAPTNEELAYVADTLSIDFDDLTAATDPEEHARVQVEDGYSLILFDVPITDVRNDVETYDTIPLGVILASGCVVTVCSIEAPVIGTLEHGGVRGLDTERPINFLYQLFYQNALIYQRALYSIDRRRISFEQRIGAPASETDLIGMHELESTLVYLSTSLRGNGNVLRRVDRSTSIRGSEDDEELLDDAIIENQQAIEMAQIYHDIIDGTRELFSQVMESRLNRVMQRLTSITFILSIPTVIGGLYGMNVDLEYMPLALAPHGFGIICLACVVICAALTLWFWHRKML
jgi:magnesium transporter